jgi:hypothetical protein
MTQYSIPPHPIRVDGLIGLDLGVDSTGYNAGEFDRVQGLDIENLAE